MKSSSSCLAAGFGTLLSAPNVGPPLFVVLGLFKAAGREMREAVGEA